jgi:hypothetical protein
MSEIDGITQDQINSFCERIGDISRYSAVTISRNKIDVKGLIK